MLLSCFLLFLFFDLSVIHCGVGKNDENREDCKEAKDRLPVHTRSHEEHRNEWGQESPHRIPHMKQIQILIGTSRRLTDRMIVDDRDHALRDSDQEDHHIKHRDRKSHCKQEEAHRIGDRQYDYRRLLGHHPTEYRIYQA